MDDEESIKVIVVGDGNVGKTCMLRRFVRGEFIEQYKKTIGAEFLEKDVFLRSTNTTVKLMLWDTAGQEVFNSLTQAYYRGAGAAIVCFSTVDRDSFVNVESWKKRVESVCGPVATVLCQTKFDLSHEGVVTNEEAEALAARLQIPFFRVSTKDDFNVTQLFEFTAQQSIDASAGRPAPSPAPTVPPLSKEPAEDAGDHQHHHHSAAAASSPATAATTTTGADGAHTESPSADKGPAASHGTKVDLSAPALDEEVAPESGKKKKKKKKGFSC